MARKTTKGKRKGPTGFKSKAQWRFFFAKGSSDPRFKKWAHEKAHATAGGPKVRFKRLPERKTAGGTRQFRRVG